ncbi:glycoside hydrolase family 16 protein [Streptomyces chartreusis]|uniref:glycoside hydrolase family 16 protein n=1 Tax=Streptomyces chartreusis TaxID=1969 RepID=UPI0033A6D8E0
MNDPLENDAAMPHSHRPLAAFLVGLTAAFATAGCAGSEEAAPPSPKGMSGDWQSVFSDDFDGTAIDKENWTVGSPYGHGDSHITEPVNTDELQCYDAGLVTVSDGTLNIRAVRKRVTCGGKTMDYASGMVNTKDHFQQRYGAMEARIQLPAAAPGVIANWPAFWQVGADWPEDGENDVMEGLLGRACFHFRSAAGERGERGGCADGDYTGWHTFGANWQPGRVEYYYDGKLVGTVTKGVTDAPQWFMLNYSVQRKVGGPTRLPADMRVDYVRAWQR